MSNTYYVRKTGNDANTGTDPNTDAVLTIARAYDDLCNGDDVIDIGEGTWTEDIYLNRANGDPVDNITWQGAGMYKTTIQGNAKHPNSTSCLSDPLIFKDLKIELAAAISYDFRCSGDMTFNDVWIDCNGKDGPYLFLFGGDSSVYMRRCIFNDLLADTHYNFCKVGGTTVVRMESCVLYNLKGSVNYVFMTSESGKLITKNCIFSECDGYNNADQSSWTSTYDTMHNVGSGLPANLTDTTGNITDDPQFEDPANEDFSLKDTSPCTGAGRYWGI